MLKATFLFQTCGEQQRADGGRVANLRRHEAAVCLCVKNSRTKKVWLLRDLRDDITSRGERGAAVRCPISPSCPLVSQRADVDEWF